jgi:hypothetical protein
VSVRIQPILPLLAILACMCVPASAQYPNSGSPLGINVSSPSDFSTQIVWYDMFMWFRGWEQSPDGSPLPAAQLDSSGWVKSLNAGQEAWVGHGAGTNSHYPGGNYLLTWEGDGAMGVRQACSFVSYDSVNHRAVVRVDSTQAWFGVKITRTNAANYIRNIHVYMPGFWDTGTFQLKAQYRNDPWHPDFISMIERFRCLRFMDWGATNGSNAVEWSDIKPANWWNQSSSDYRINPGQVSPLWMVRLCNRIHADGWFNLPAKASDDCITKYATLVRDSLASDVKVYIEYSNECWNWGFAQTGYCRDQGVALGITGGGPAEYYALRSSQMWRIFESVFGSQKGRLVKVLAGQAAGIGNFDYMFAILNNATLNPDNIRPSALAVAPYIDNDGTDAAALPIATLTPDQFFDGVMNTILPAKRTHMQQMVAYAQGKSLPLIAYEGGQSFVGSGTQAVNYYVAANQNPRMKGVYLQYLRDWFAVGGGLFMHYSSCGLGGQYGSWGAKEWYNQPRAQAPKWDALMTFIEDSVGLVSVAPQRELTVLCAGASGSGQPLRIFSLSGRLLDVRAPLGSASWPIAWSSRAAPGAYILNAGTVSRAIRKN